MVNFSEPPDTGSRVGAPVAFESKTARDRFTQTYAAVQAGVEENVISADGTVNRSEAYTTAMGGEQQFLDWLFSKTGNSAIVIGGVELDASHLYNHRHSGTLAKMKFPIGTGSISVIFTRVWEGGEQQVDVQVG